MILTDRAILLEIERGNIRFEPDISREQGGPATGDDLRIPE